VGDTPGPSSAATANFVHPERSKFLGRDLPPHLLDGLPPLGPDQPRARSSSVLTTHLTNIDKEIQNLVGDASDGGTRVLRTIFAQGETIANAIRKQLQ
jgi:hypothetical protein